MKPSICTISSKIILAIPRDKGDQPGYFVRHPDGHEAWIPKAIHERSVRQLSQEEINLIRSSTPRLVT